MTGNVNVLFLDIDGVMRPDCFIELTHISLGGSQYPPNAFKINERFAPWSIDVLKMLLNRNPKLYIVISSEWRRNMARVYRAFEYNGLPTEKIIGKTHHLNKLKTRGEEINKFLNDYDCLVDNYLVIDDDDIEGIGNKIIVDKKMGLSFNIFKEIDNDTELEWLW